MYKLELRFIPTFIARQTTQPLKKENIMKRNLLVTVFAATLLFSAKLSAQDAKGTRNPGDPDWLKDTWSIEVGFGEIPFLSGSFKPSVSFGYYANQYFYVGGTVQLHDILERGTASFNARNTGLGHIDSTREVTGIRSLIGARIRPHRYAPYMAVGMLFNGSDREEMQFGDTERIIGANTYTGTVTVVQTRPWAIRPAVGLGYGVQFQNGVTFSAELTGAFYWRAPAPEIQIVHHAGLTDADERQFVKKMQKEFKDNFHNRYHLFNIGAGYVW